MAAKAQRSGIDWPAIRRLYEATVRREFSTRQIARDHGVTETAIRKKAKAEKWLRRDQRENLLCGSRSNLDKIVGWPRHRFGRSERGSSFSPDEYGGRATGGVASVLSAPMSPAEPETDRARVRKLPLRRELPPIKSREDRKVTPEDLIDRLSHVADSLLYHIRIAIDRRDTVIKMMEEWEPSTGGRIAAKYAVLQKEVDLKKLSAALLNVTIVVKFIDDQSSGRRAKGATSGR
jgi:hypothetical protein